MEGEHLKNNPTCISEWSLCKLFICQSLMYFKRGEPRRETVSYPMVTAPQ